MKVEAKERIELGSDEMEPQILLVLCGVVGSGKSTLAQATVRELPGDWSRVNQDDLGSRPACESLVRRRLSEVSTPLYELC